MISPPRVTRKLAKQQCANQTELAQLLYCILREQSKETGAVPSSALCSKCVLFQISLQLDDLVFQLVHRVTTILGRFQQGPRILQGIPSEPLPPADCC